MASTTHTPRQVLAHKISGSARLIFSVAAALAISIAASPSVWADNAKVERYSKAPSAEKINVNLLRVEQRMRSPGITLATAIANSGMRTDAKGLRLNILTDNLDAVVKEKFSLPGVRVTDFSERYKRVAVTIDDPTRLFDLANIPEVRRIAPEYGARTHVGSVDSRASEAMRADIARGNFSVDGSGQIVGILSDSFALTPGVRDADTLPATGAEGILTGSRSQDSGDLPATVNILRDDLDLLFGTGSGIDEGAAMAELVADVAPGAGLAFHTAFISEASFAEGITALRTEANASVLVDDVLYFNEPMYQDGIIAQSATAAVAAGVPYFSSAGNFANRGLRQNFVDIAAADDQAISPTGNDLHDFGGGDGFLDITVPAQSSILAILQWNQPFESVNMQAGAQIDLDIYLTGTADVAGLGSPLSASIDQQGTTENPLGDAVELVEFTNGSLAPVTIFLAIEHFAGRQGAIPQNTATPLEFRLVFIESADSIIPGITDANSTSGAPTIFGHAIAPGVMSVAAVPWFDTAAFNPGFTPSPVTDPEPFTARGGSLTVQFDAAGAYAPRTSFEPDIAAVDGNGTSFFFPGSDLDLGGFEGEPNGIPNFFGTSAAAPNAAGVAGLLLQADDAQSPASLNAVLASTAIDIVGARAAPGIDDVTGAGLIDAAAAVAVVANLPNADAGVDQRANPNAAVTLNGLGSNDPNGSITNFAWVQTAGEPVTLTGADTATPSFTAPGPAQTLSFELTVTDNSNLVDTDSVNVIVNTPPVANAGPDQSVRTNGAITLNGAGSSDSDGSIASFSWVQTAGSTVILSGADTASPSFTAPGAAQTLTFQLTVTDNEGATGVDTVNVTVRANSGGGGCVLAAESNIDPVLLLLLVFSGVYLTRRGRHIRRV